MWSTSTLSARASLRSTPSMISTISAGLLRSLRARMASCRELSPASMPRKASRPRRVSAPLPRPKEWSLNRVRLPDDSVCSTSQRRPDPPGPWTTMGPPAASRDSCSQATSSSRPTKMGRGARAFFLAGAAAATTTWVGVPTSTGSLLMKSCARCLACSHFRKRSALGRANTLNARAATTRRGL